MLIARVAVDVPVDTLFDYLPGPATAADIGRRVLVPFGRRQTVGVLRGFSRESVVSEPKLKPVTQVLTDVPALDEAVLGLLDFCAHYYRHPIGETILRALPTRLRSARPIASRREPAFVLTERGRERVRARPPPRRSLPWRVLEQLEARDRARASGLRDLGPHVGSTLRSLLRRGLIEEAIAFEPRGARSLAPGPKLTPQQEQAVAAVADERAGFRVWLLQGVTGSGKTEVYLRLMEAMLSAGKQVLYLVPEINLTPQLEAFVRRRACSARLVALHSALAEGERASNWLLAQRGDTDIVLGTRLAVFTPMPKLGMIVVDEEHDSSFKQQEGLRYSARDVAVMRAKQADVPIVLGSATPALETYFRALSGRYQLLRLTTRASGAQPAIALLNTRGERLEQGIGEAALHALSERLARNQQTLIFINRRGFAPVLHCRACNWFAGCPRCSCRLVVHLRDRLLVCHLCGHRETLPQACNDCGNVDLAPIGQGTQRVESYLGTRYPSARVLRVDRDTTRAKRAWQDMRDQIASNEVDVLVGTQMLAKGHDFPRLTLVIVLNADSALFSADFRAAERLFAQLMQVAGRAGRADLPGEVIVQTEFPDHPVYRALVAQDYDGFSRLQLAERERAGFPPAAYQALLRAEAFEAPKLFSFLESAAGRARSLDAPVEVYDPVPAVRRRVAGLHRGQLLVQSRSRSRLHAFLDAWHPSIAVLGSKGVRWALDVDPLDL